MKEMKLRIIKYAMIPQLNVPLYMICLILIVGCNHNCKKLHQLTMFKFSMNK